MKQETPQNGRKHYLRFERIRHIFDKGKTNKKVLACDEVAMTNDLKMWRELRAVRRQKQ